MTDLELINSFFSKEDLAGTELILKEKCMVLDRKLNTAREELEEASKVHSQKQNEVLAFSQQLQSLLQVVLEVAKKSLESDTVKADQAELDVE